MNIWGIQIGSRSEKSAILKQVILSLNIGAEEKDLYLVSIDILNDRDFSLFFENIMKQIEGNKENTREMSIEPLTSQII